MAIIEDRVLALKIDTSQFEAGIKRSLSNLGKIKEVVDFAQVNGGFKELSKNIGSLKFGNISVDAKRATRSVADAFLTMSDKAVEAAVVIEQRFKTSSLILAQTMGVALGNMVTNLGKKVYDGLFGPMKDGFREYELKMGSIQTILANSSPEETLENVNNVLDTLNAYADRTIYNFGQMTQNLGLFTNAGIAAKPAADMIKGFSNAAAAAGAKAEDAARGAYQLSQALTTGVVRLEDWRSLTNAGMGGAKMKQDLVNIAKDLGTLSGDTSSVLNNFNDSLSKKWLTTDVMGTYLKAMSDDLYETDESVKRLSKDTLELLKVNSKAGFEAATKVRTFTQLMDTMGEAIGSGWSETAQLLFGDFEQATTIFTAINDVADKVISTFNDLRNAPLKKLLETGGREKIINAIGEGLKRLSEVVGAFKEGFNTIIPPPTYNSMVKFAKIVERFFAQLKASQGMLLAFKNIGAGVASIIKLATGILKVFAFTLSIVISVIARLLEPVFKVVGALGLLISSIFGLTSSLGGATAQSKIFQKIIIELAGVLDFLIRIINFVADVIVFLVSAITRAGNVADHFYEVMYSAGVVVGEFAGYVSTAYKAIKSYLIDTFDKASTNVKNFFKSFKNTSALDKVKSIFDSIKNSLDSLSKKLNELAQNDKLSKIFAPFLLLAKKVNSAFQTVRMNIESLRGLSVGEILSKLWSGLKNVSSTLYEKLFDPDKIRAGFEKLASSYTDLLKAIKLKKGFKIGIDFSGIKKNISEFVNTLRPSIVQVGIETKKAFASIDWEGIADTIGTKLGQTLKYVGLNIGKLVLSLLKGVALAVVGAAATLGRIILKALEQILPPQAMAVIYNALDWVKLNAPKVLAGLRTALDNAWSGLKVAFDWVTTNFSGTIRELGKLLSKIWELFTKNPVQGFANGFDKLKTSISGFIQTLKMNLNAEEFVGILGAINMLFSAIQLNRITGTIAEIKSVFTGFKDVGPALEGTLDKATKTLGTMQKELRSRIILNIALAIGILAISLAVLSKIPQDKLATGILGLAGAMIILVIAMRALDRVDFTSDNWFEAGNMLATAAMFVALAASLMMLSKAMMYLSTMDWKQICIGLAAIAALLIGLGLAVKFIPEKNLIKTAISLFGMAKAVENLAVSMIAFSRMDWEMLGKGVTAFIAIIGSMVAVSMFVKPVKIAMVAASTALLAKAMNVFRESLRGFNDLDYETMGKAGATLAGALVLLTAAAKIAGGANLVVAAASIFVYSNAIVGIAAAFKMFASVEWEEIKKGVTILLTAATVLVSANKALSNPIGVIAFTGSLIGMVYALKQYIEIVKTLAQIPFGTIFNGLSKMVMIILPIALILSMASKQMAQAGIGILAVAYSMDKLIDAMNRLKELKLKEVGEGSAKVAAIITSIGLSARSIQSAGFKAALSLLVISASLGMMGEAIGKFNEAGIGDMAKAIGSLNAALLSMGGSVKALSKVGIADIAKSLIMMGGVVAGISMLAWAFKQLVGIPWGEVAKAAGIIAGFFAIMVAIPVLLSAFTPAILAFSGSLALFGGSVALFGLGVLALSIAFTTLAGSVVALSGTLTLLGFNLALMLTTFIVTLGVYSKRIGTALKSLFVEIGRAILDAVNELLPQLEATLITFIEELVDVVVALISELFVGIFDVVLESIIKLADLFREKGDLVFQAGLDLWETLCVYTEQYMPTVIDRLTLCIIRLINNLADSIHKNKPYLQNAGARLMYAMFEDMFRTIGSWAETIEDAIASLIENIVNGYRKVKAMFTGTQEAEYKIQRKFAGASQISMPAAIEPEHTSYYQGQAQGIEDRGDALHDKGVARGEKMLGDIKEGQDAANEIASEGNEIAAEGNEIAKDNNPEVVGGPIKTDRRGFGDGIADGMRNTKGEQENTEAVKENTGFIEKGLNTLKDYATDALGIMGDNTEALDSNTAATMASGGGGGLSSGGSDFGSGGGGLSSAGGSGGGGGFSSGGNSASTEREQTLEDIYKDGSLRSEIQALQDYDDEVRQAKEETEALFDTLQSALDTTNLEGFKQAVADAREEYDDSTDEAILNKTEELVKLDSQVLSAQQDVLSARKDLEEAKKKALEAGLDPNEMTAKMRTMYKKLQQAEQKYSFAMGARRRKQRKLDGQNDGDAYAEGMALGLTESERLIASAASYIFSAMASRFDAMKEKYDNIKSLTDNVTGMMGSFKTISDNIFSIGRAMERIGEADSAYEVFRNLEIIGNNISEIVEAFNPFFELGTKFTTVLDMMGVDYKSMLQGFVANAHTILPFLNGPFLAAGLAAVAALFIFGDDANAEKFQKMVSNLVNIAIKALTKLPSMIAGVLKKIPKAIRNIIKFLPKLVKDITVGFIGAFVELVKNFPSIIFELLTAFIELPMILLQELPSIFMELVTGVGSAIFSGLSAIFSFIFDPSQLLATVWTFITGVWNVITGTIQTIFNFGKAIVSLLFAFLKAPFGSNDDSGDSFGSFANTVWEKIKDGFKAIVGFFAFIGGLLISFLTNPGDVISSVVDFGGKVWEWIKQGFEAVVGFVGMILGGILKLLSNDENSGIVDKVVEFGGKVWEWIKQGFNAVTDFLGMIGGAIWSFIKSPGKIFEWLGDFGKSIWNGIKSGFDKVKDFGNTLKDGVVSGVKKAGSFMGRVFGVGKDMATNIKDGVVDGAKKIGEIGGSVVTGFINGVEENVRKVAEAGGKVVNAVLGPVVKRLRINSPSKVFMEIGGSVNEGFALGIENSTYMSTKASLAVAEDVISTFKDTMESGDYGVSAIQDAVNDMSKGLHFDASDIIGDGNIVITPELDDSKVKEGFETIKGYAPDVSLSASNLFTSAQDIFKQRDDSAAAANTNNNTTIEFNQYNTSPEALSALDIYRNTKTMLDETKRFLLDA